ncbi:hypothetical protein EAH81_10325 [Flavobacterium pectinovorum]|uniref:Uncharacterized protein n=1 Tax=Flavobacterium pectinovorum TaxID=29533 RepID=A0A502ESC8_9FLAO|nr:hypothetical protein EAH81_10325 [Flavobacterium pectinovorum]
MILLHFFQLNIILCIDFEINLPTIKNKASKSKLSQKRKAKPIYIHSTTKSDYKKAIRNLYFSLGIVYNEILKLTTLYLFLILFFYYNEQELLWLEYYN